MAVLEDDPVPSLDALSQQVLCVALLPVAQTHKLQPLTHNVQPLSQLIDGVAWVCCLPEDKENGGDAGGFPIGLVDVWQGEGDVGLPDVLLHKAVDGWN